MAHTRNETKYDTLVGRNGDEYIFLQYTFSHDDGFHGATGTSIRPVSKEEYEERTSPEGLLEYLGESWQDAVASGETELGKEDWCTWVYDMDGDDALFDLSYRNLWEQARKANPELTVEAYPIFECVGAGRMFSVGMTFEQVYAPALLAVIDAAEQGNT